MVFFSSSLFDDCRWKWVCLWTWQTLHAFMTATTLKKKASNTWSFTVKGMSSSPSMYAGAQAIPVCSNSSVARCFSHGECPSADTTAMFIRLCEHFIERNPTELIGEALFLLLQLCLYLWLSSFLVVMLAVRGQIRVLRLPRRVPWMELPNIPLPLCIDSSFHQKIVIFLQFSLIMKEYFLSLWIIICGIFVWVCICLWKL